MAEMTVQADRDGSLVLCCDVCGSDVWSMWSVSGGEPWPTLGRLVELADRHNCTGPINGCE